MPPLKLTRFTANINTTRLLMPLPACPAQPLSAGKSLQAGALTPLPHLAACTRAQACLHSALHPAGRTACRCISASPVPAGHSAELMVARQWRAACFSAPQVACHCRLNCCTRGYEQAPARSKSSSALCCKRSK